MAGAVAIGLSFSNAIQNRKDYDENSALVQKCMNKAAGEDGILHPAEGIALARSLGYTGAILPDEKIILQSDVQQMQVKPNLFIGYQSNPTWRGSEYREKLIVSREAMQKYLYSK